MTCNHFGTAIICTPHRVDRLHCRDGRRVRVEWHNFGPVVTHDRYGDRIHEEWFDDPPVAEAVEWWIRRGRRG